MARWALPMTLSLLSLLSLFATSIAVSLPSAASSTFPQCALSCPALQQASMSCAAGGPDSWLSCLCNAPLISSLRSSGEACSSCTATSDQILLSKWYNNYCEVAHGTRALQAKRDSGTSSQNQSWWSTHYRWVVMVIVLAVAFALIAALGVYFKRRYDAKHIPYMVAAPSPGFTNSAGVLAPAPVAGTSPIPGPRPPRSTGPGSLASSSRTDLPRGPTPLGNNRRLTKGAQTPAGDVEIRQMSRSRP